MNRHTDGEDPSAILTALGIPRAAALGAVRRSLGRATTMDEIADAVTALGAAWRLVSDATTAPAI